MAAAAADPDDWDIRHSLCGKIGAGIEGPAGFNLSGTGVEATTGG